MYKKLTITEEERAALKAYGEWCPAMAQKYMERNRWNFDDVEAINRHAENHRWGSKADRAYRARAIRCAVAIVAVNPAAYIMQEVTA